MMYCKTTFKRLSLNASCDAIVDFWLSALVFFVGFHIAIEEPIETIPQYHFLLERGITSAIFGWSAMGMGMINIIRIFVDMINHEIVDAGLKSANLSVCLLLCLTTLDNNTIPVGFVFYGMTSLLALFIVLKRTI